jgi:multidrug efflux pump subunit AcrA (membrane-fusion protein)
MSLLNGIRPDMLPGTEPSPSFPSGAPGGMPEQPEQGGMQKFAQILRVALPAIAAIYGAKNGGAEAFAQSYGGNEQIRQSNLHRTAELRERVEARKSREGERAQAAARQAQLDAAQAERAQQQLQNEIQRREAAENDRIRNIVQRAVDQAAENPAFMEKVNKAGPEAFSLPVPGMPPMNLKEAFDRLGVIQDQDGQYQYGKPQDDPLVTLREEGVDGNVTEELIPRSKRAAMGKVTVSRPTAKTPAAPKSQEHTDVNEEGEDGQTRRYRIYFKPDGTVDRKVLISGPPEEAAATATGSNNDPLGIRTK